LLTDWNDTSRDDSNDLCIHELFERRAESRPDAPAVTFGEITVTYRALNAMANRLARRLVEHGVGPETLVGICVERSLDMIVGLLGVLKAGGAYLPLDPINPNERLAFMIEDAGPSLILTQGELSERLPTNVPSWRLDAIQRDTDPCDDRNLEARACRQNLAYVIYTSGSTGRPKGVMVAHAGLANYTHEVLARLPKSPAGLNFALVSTFGADLGNTVLFASLAASGCLHLPTRETVADPALIKSYIEEHRIDVLKITPSHLSAISGTDETYEFCPREALFLGGEALSSEIVRNAATRAPLCRQFNHYGPTECTVGVLMHQIDDPGSQVGHIPLGRPIANTRLFIVGAEFELVPMGAAGELLIDGIGLARGYLGRPDLTAERFVPDPFGGEGTRLYRTGDLVRYRRDGVIEFLGRIDDQIKIRGYRVETGEIEAALSQIDGVRACAVVFQNKPGRTQLVAHIVPKSGREFQQESLRRTLSRALPDHMIPSAFALVDSLPLTPNGKVDRKALIAIDWAAPPAPGYEAPRTFTEGALCRIWADLLGLERVGAEDNFFALGGHSLLAAQATARISRELMVTLPLRVLYEARTLSEVAASVDILIELARSSIAIDVEPTIAVEEIEL
jgi:amino acid adenylation domain-containing protein